MISECVIRWWNWLHTQKEADSKSGDSKNLRREISDQDKSLENCPVCRKVFHSSDIEHVLHLVGSHLSQQDSSLIQGVDKDPLLQSDSENMRRERFEAILKTQEEKGGLVQPKKNISVVPGMYLPPPPAPATSSSNGEEETRQCQEQGEEEHKEAESETNSSSSNNRRGRGRGRGRGRSRGDNVNRRKQNSQDSRKPTTMQWVQRS